MMTYLLHNVNCFWDFFYQTDTQAFHGSRSGLEDGLDSHAVSNDLPLQIAERFMHSTKTLQLLFSILVPLVLSLS